MDHERHGKLLSFVWENNYESNSDRSSYRWNEREIGKDQLHTIRYDFIIWFCLFQVSFARPSSESIKFSNLYVSNLPSSMTQQELESMFADFGCIISSKILSNPKAGSDDHPSFKWKQLARLDTLAKSMQQSQDSFILLGASKSVGFIRFDQRSEAELAISKLNGTIPKGNWISAVNLFYQLSRSSGIQASPILSMLNSPILPMPLNRWSVYRWHLPIYPE